MRDLAVDPRSVRLLIEKRMESGRQHTGKGFRIAPETTELFKRSMDRARSQGRRVIEASDIFYRAFERRAEHSQRRSPESGSSGRRGRADRADPHSQTRKEEERVRQKYELPSFLRHFGVSMNKLARQDKIPPTIGREKEIRQMIEILCHRERSNSPMLVGEPGVGKTRRRRGFGVS
ncbi:MAG: ATP-dependent Clp protease ATP-binding subunit [Acidobacteria bacterium]|nr:ATP-dependent Clp protease ATP-binding subunit [Acidobacteriota bacterium]